MEEATECSQMFSVPLTISRNSAGIALKTSCPKDDQPADISLAGQANCDTQMPENISSLVKVDSKEDLINEEVQLQELRSSSFASIADSNVAASNIAKLLGAFLTNDYANMHEIDSVVLNSKETRKFSYDKLIEGIKYLSSNLINRPQRCHIWIRNMQPDDLLACIKQMTLAKASTRRTLLRLELRDVYTSVKALAAGLLHLKHLGLTVRTSNLFASVRDESSKIIHKGLASFAEFVSNEHILKQTPSDLLLHINISHPARKNVMIYAHYFDKVLLPLRNTLRHQYLTVDHVFSQQPAVTFGEDAPVHEFEVELDPETGDFMPTSMANPPVGNLAEFMQNFCFDCTDADTLQ